MGKMSFAGREKILETCHSNTIRHAGDWSCVLGKKSDHCWRRLPNCQDIESWEGCRLWWSLTWNVQSF